MEKADDASSPSSGGGTARCSQSCLNNRAQCVVHPFNPRRNRSSWPLAKFSADAAEILAAAFVISAREVGRDTELCGSIVISRDLQHSTHIVPSAADVYLISATQSQCCQFLSVNECKRRTHDSPATGCTKFPPPLPQLQRRYCG